jgi:cytochrome b pre-mRNA-processing protein 3
MFAFLRRKNLLRDDAIRLLDALSTQARHPDFFTRFAVPDTLDGRFEMLTVHAALVFPALAAQRGEPRKLAQEATDAFFIAIDQALREEGVGDGGIPRRVKAMGRAYLGRVKAYTDALGADDDGSLRAALHRNVWRGHTAPGGAVAALSTYMRSETRRLAAITLAEARAGGLGFPPPPEF